MNTGNSASVEVEMPRYRCHKEVYALKIRDIVQPYLPEGCESDGSAIIIPEESGYAGIPVSHEYIRKHQPQVGGYFVIYEDGYRSFSPAAAFESGYARI